VGWVIEVLFTQLFCKEILDCWRLTVTYDALNVALTPVLSLPSFTGNRNNIDIFLYNWRALLAWTTVSIYTSALERRGQGVDLKSQHVFVDMICGDECAIILVAVQAPTQYIAAAAAADVSICQSMQRQRVVSPRVHIILSQRATSKHTNSPLVTAVIRLNSTRNYGRRCTTPQCPQ